ncbi:TPA: hypothetical protein DEW49_00260 [bacterium]|nr:hypothetical protein [bacterium]
MNEYVKKLNLKEKERVKQTLLKDVKYHCPQLQEVWLELMTLEEWPPKEIKGQLAKDWSEDELNGVQVRQNGLPLFVRKEAFPLFNQLMEKELPLVELKQLSPEDKLLCVVEAMLNIQSYIELLPPTPMVVASHQASVSSPELTYQPKSYLAKAGLD